MSTLSPPFAQELLDAIDRMHAFPASVQSILRLTRDAGMAPRDLVDVIQRDPVITIKVLRVVNSAYYSLSKPMTSVDHAVVFLGFNTIKNLALSIAALGLAPAHLHAAFDKKAYLQHSLATAAIARRLGARFPQPESNDFFIGGLLHDFGKIVLAQVIPEQFNKALEYGLWHGVSLHSALMEVTGIDQSEVGAMLLEHWQFPADLVDGIRHQYVRDASAPVLSVCIQAANQMCKRKGMDFAASDAALALSAPMEQALGGTLDSIMDSLGDMSQILHEVTQFSDL
ncbi:HDOD domain-containing protein [Rhodoferax lacus]|uniref:HDOD domain-containing protein n=1 Tax=Rhodoferax lacus TaxID=2184758 RepID=UPI001F20BE5B|nr:HDOD domain-containing protein [Rhodoferax lacus]